MTWLVWSNIGPAGGEDLHKIITRKEAERRAGNQIFWWGLGTPLGPAIADTATSNGGCLPAIFSKILGPAQKKDFDPDEVCVWNGWRSVNGRKSGIIPDHVLVTGGVIEKSYYALICNLEMPIALGDHGVFDPSHYRTRTGRKLGWSQRAALLETVHQSAAPQGRLRVAFGTDLVAPWYVQLTDGRTLTQQERQLIDAYHDGDDWRALVSRLRESI